ncbi:MAG: HAD-IB family hydrolase [bacterium]|nr:HAD-IB family hydrolase [bacterium]
MTLKLMDMDTEMDKQKQSLALFDFDGTITAKDSFVDFLKYAVGKPRFYMGMALMSPMMALFFAKLFPAAKMKAMVISHFFKGMREDRFKEIATEYANGPLNSLVKQSALDRIAWHKKEGHTIAVVSASFFYWIQPWCNKHNLPLLASTLEIKDSKLTGKLSGKNCKNEEKVRRIKEHFNLENFNHIYAYGDSSGDTEMLALADEPFYRNFH